VREALRKIPQELDRLRVDLLGEKADVVSERDELARELGRLVVPARARATSATVRPSPIAA
jgi:hypothetical protein